MKQFYSLKNLAIILAVCVVFTSCSTKDVSAPVNNQAVPVSYQDANISISNFKAAQASNNVQVSFSVLYENNVAKIEVLSGASQNQLCSFYSIGVSSNTESANNFSVDDKNIKGSTMYYMIKFTLTDGNWGYTPVYSLQVK